MILTFIARATHFIGFEDMTNHLLIDRNDTTRAGFTGLIIAIDTIVVVLKITTFGHEHDELANIR